MDSMHNPLPESLDIPQRKVDALLQHYGLSHTHPVNEVIHFVAIPAIMLSLNGLLFALHPALVLVLIAGSLVYYARLSWPFTLCMLLLSSLMLALVCGRHERRRCFGASERGDFCGRLDFSIHRPPSGGQKALVL